MSATHAVNDVSRVPNPGRVAALVTWLRRRLHNVVRPDWRLFRATDSADELIVGHYGPVEIHQTLPGWSLETCVKGEPDRARETALRRLGNFVHGKNASGMRLRVARPLVQSAEGIGRWRLCVALPGLDEAVAMASARNGKVRLHARHSKTLAVIRVPGRPTKLAIQHAETAIRTAIALSRWQPAGEPMLRLHTQPPVMPFLGRFEVAVPVVERVHGHWAGDWISGAINLPPAVDAPTRASPPLH